MDQFKPFIEVREFMGYSLAGHDRGWGNGYVHLPPDHKWYKMNYMDIPVEIHGGLTYSDWDDEYINWVIGFDTSHSGDSLDKWPKERVIEETNRLLKQCI